MAIFAYREMNALADQLRSQVFTNHGGAGSIFWSSARNLLWEQLGSTNLLPVLATESDWIF